MSFLSSQISVNIEELNDCAVSTIPENAFSINKAMPPLSAPVWHKYKEADNRFQCLNLAEV
jgi:hypothetical protein